MIRILGQAIPLSQFGPPNGARLIDEFVSKKRAEGASESTIAKELVTLRASLKIARRRGLWRGDPGEVLPVGFAPEYKPRSRSLTPEELQKLLAQLTPDYAARVAFIVATSACWGESDRALREDVSPDLRQVLIRGTKRASRYRPVPIVSEQQRSLLAYAMKHAQGSAELFLRWGKRNRDLRAACDRGGHGLVFAERPAPDLRDMASRVWRAAGSHRANLGA